MITKKGDACCRVLSGVQTVVGEMAIVAAVVVASATSSCAHWRCREGGERAVARVD